MQIVDTVAASLGHWFNNEDNAPQGGVTGGVQFRPGLLIPPLDNWEECAMLWLTAGRRWRSSSFPVTETVQRCAGDFVMELTVGVARCSNALGELGQPPTVEQMGAEFDVQEDDKSRLENAVCAAMRTAKDKLQIGEWARSAIEVEGPMGGTVAIYTTITMTVLKEGLKR